MTSMPTLERRAWWSAVGASACCCRVALQRETIQMRRIYRNDWRWCLFLCLPASVYVRLTDCQWYSVHDYAVGPHTVTLYNAPLLFGLAICYFGQGCTFLLRIFCFLSVRLSVCLQDSWKWGWVFVNNELNFGFFTVFNIANGIAGAS